MKIGQFIMDESDMPHLINSIIDELHRLEKENEELQKESIDITELECEIGDLEDENVYLEGKLDDIKNLLNSENQENLIEEIRKIIIR
jgi:hypothetical protein